MDAQFLAALAGIIWIDLLLSGDNAVVIAMVCRQLPARQQRIGMVLGAGAAVGLRIVFAFLVAWLIAIPGLSLIGGCFLLWVAAGLVMSGGDGAHDATPRKTLLGAVVTIAIADAGMSLDNVMAIAALSHGSAALMAFGVLLSIPIVIAGSAMISGAIARFPALVWASGGLLGWVAGGIIVTDPYVIGSGVLGPLAADPHAAHYAAAVLGTLAVLAAGALARMRAPAVGAA